MEVDDDECDRVLSELFAIAPPTARDDLALLPPLGDFDPLPPEHSASDWPPLPSPSPSPSHSHSPSSPPPTPDADTHAVASDAVASDAVTPALHEAPRELPVIPSCEPSRNTSRAALRARPVVYKSRHLARVAPSLVAAASCSVLSAASSIRAANRTAEAVRDAFKSAKEQEMNAARLASDASNADKYERRLKMNRWSAAASRVRRDAYTKALEAELVRMERAFRQLVGEPHERAVGDEGDDDRVERLLGLVVRDAAADAAVQRGRAS